MTTYSPSLRLWMGTPFDPAIRAAWGPPLNTNDILIDNAINAQAPISLAGLSSYTVTTANGAPDQARCAVLNFVDTPAGACVVTLPNVPRVGWTINNTTGGFTVTLTAGAGTTAAIPSDGAYHLYVADGSGNMTLPSLTGATSTNVSGSTLTITGNGLIGGNLTVSGTTNVNGLGASSISSVGTIAGLGQITANTSVVVGSGLNPQTSITNIKSTGGSAIFINTVQPQTTQFTALVANLGSLSSNYAAWQFGGTTFGSIVPLGTGGVAYNTTSDQRLKINQGIIEGVGNLIDKLKPRWFTWRDSPDDKPEPGFFAQEVSRVWRWAVTKGTGRASRKNLVPWQMDASKLIPLLVAEIQDLRRRVADLERRP